MPDGGTGAFASDGYYLPDCESQPVDPTTGEATCTTSTDFVAAALYEIDAVYSGDDSYQASQGTSASLLMVSPGPTTVTVDTPIPDAASVGQLVTLTRPNHQPDLQRRYGSGLEDNGQAIAGCNGQTVDETDGDATCTTALPTAGNDVIDAAYSGDTDYLAARRGHGAGRTHR